LARENKEPDLTRCHGLNCSNQSLINAHILPKGFSRLIRTEPEAELLKVAAGGVGPAYPQLGETDRNILCAECDSTLGKNDGYAVQVCRDFKPDNPGSELFQMKSVDAERFSKFILSFLWRASISASGRYCGVVTFGMQYEPLACEIIFGSRPIADIPAFKLFVMKLRSDKHDVSRTTTDPIRFKFEGLDYMIENSKGLRSDYNARRNKKQSLFDFLGDNLNQYFKISSSKISEDGTKARALESNEVLKRLLRIDTISAQRHLDDEEATGAAKLSRLLHDHYNQYYKVENVEGANEIEAAVKSNTHRDNVAPYLKGHK
jgi:hypothetical protein